MSGLSAAVWAGILLAGNPAPLVPPNTDGIGEVRSVTYYTFGTELSDLDLEHLREDVERAKAAGFNGMWLVVPWRTLSPVALPDAELNQAAWEKLDAAIRLLTEERFLIVFPLGYLGKGWAPDGIPDTRVDTWILDEAIWQAFRAHVIRLTRRYADLHNMLWLFYSESFQGPLSLYENQEQAKAHFRAFCRGLNADIAHWNARWGSDYTSFYEVGMDDGRFRQGNARWEDHFRWICAVMRKRYGPLARELKDLVRIHGRVGFHDNALIEKDWAKGDSPIPEESPYDFLSFTAYLGQEPVQVGLKNAEEALGRFREKYPEVPLMIGEVGVPTLVRGEDAQAAYLRKVAEFAETSGLGINIWMWRDFAGGPEDQRSFGLVRLDGTHKPALGALEDLWRKRLSGSPKTTSE